MYLNLCLFCFRQIFIFFCLFFSYFNMQVYQKANNFIQIALTFPVFKSHVGSIKNRAFRAIFGTPASVVASLWDHCSSLAPDNSQKKHLLWCLVFLKVYSTEEVHCGLVGTNPKTFRKWSWEFAQIISSLHIVS